MTMSSGLPSAPWLQPQDVTGSYMRGAALGQQAASEQAQLAMAGQRLQQQAQQTQMELEQRKQEHQRQSLMQQQQMEVQKAYQQAQLGLAQQKLQETQKVNQMKIQDAARKSALMMSAQKEIEGGGDPVEVYAKYGPQLYGAGGSGYLKAYADQQKRANATLPQTPEQKATLARNTHEYNKIISDQMALKKTMAEAKDPEIRAQLQDQINRMTIRRGRLEATAPASMAAPATSTGTDPAPAGAPTIAGRYENGKLMMTPQEGSGHAVIGNPAGADATQPAAQQGLSIGGMPIGGAAPAAAPQPQATLPASAQPTQAADQGDDVLRSYRIGQMSKTDAQKALGHHITGPEWVEEDKSPKWHWDMQEDDSGKMSHTYSDKKEGED